MDRQHVKVRMDEIMVLIDKSIELTDSSEEMLMLACAMLQRTNEIFNSTLGEEGRKQMFKDYV
jgi:hypothetical protein